ncbi:phosphoadenosine phosphosulfate reductase domain-containing protein [Saccharolobus shibatae]|uniref:Phosphoadenosine phosphosulfate (PAPS) reductase n=1 Tax=Saccharolobus shibatae TaxID=2286 RepID=A0A8F5BYB1_9CREN|nr:phosphoadenosine phosphosulfate reductase family protein [Saccharolobus shibatae]QXJ33625.1 Phosphoadenosine phosphosulfate (PAPS) reductase [Saccharolobus shibatae]
MNHKLIETFRIFDLLKNENRFVLAYSGGKDSTLVSILLLRWLYSRKLSGKEVYIIHNDTQSELDILETWARDFMNQFCRAVEDTGNICQKLFSTPTQNFFVKTIVLGYPAPSFAFRWCVNHLKIIPNKEIIKKFSNKPFILITGHREDESVARASIIKKNSLTSCPLSDYSCNSSFFMNLDVKNGVKIMPIKNWTANEVWQYLATVNDFDLSGLYLLYNGNSEARYGCWHCTLVKIQKNIYNLPDNYYYLEALRIIYRAISDIDIFREKKEWGYSKLGPLNALGRGFLLKLFPITEKYSGKRFYGLDEYKIEDYSLRELFYEIDPDKADNIIQKIKFRTKGNRFISIKTLRIMEINRYMIDKIYEYIKRNIAYNILEIRGTYTEKLLNEI